MKNIGFYPLLMVAIVFALLAIKAQHSFVAVLDIAVSLCFLVLAWDDYKRGLDGE